MDRGSIARRARGLVALLTAASAALWLGACGEGGPGANSTGDTAAPGTAGGSSCIASNPATTAECGTVLVAVTDADGDFVSYAVDVLAVTLRRAGGGSVETLPGATRIDFAQLTDLSELVGAAMVAPGDIVGGTIRLDYGSAEIFVESGGAIVPAIAVDARGEPLGVVDLQIDLDDRDRLVVTRGRAVLLSIDFDLAASHEVDLSTTPVHVLARPYLAAEVRPIVDKSFRLRGALVDVDVTAGSYDIVVRPGHERDGDFGVVTVATTNTTTFEVDGETYTGVAGLEALASLAPDSLTVAVGTLDAERNFTAQSVQAGDSIGGERYSAIEGNVVARSGDTLTVKGALVVHHDRPAHFRRTVTVTIGPDTGVTQVGDPDAVLGKDDISVGQRIVALGQLDDPGADSAAPPAADVPLVLDATAGRVRMQATHLEGTVTSVLAGQIDLRLQAIDRLGIDLFDFAGTGATPQGDADPADYEIATSTLPLAGVEVGKSARVLGFVTAFGAAPPDFMGRTIVDHHDIAAVLGIGWGSVGTSTPFLSIGPTSLVLDLANEEIGERHHLLLGRRPLDLLELPAVPAIEPTDRRGMYGLQEPGHVELFASFADFSAALALRLAGGARANGLTAYGRYDEGANRLVADRVVVHLTPAG